jgi:putative membrane protein
MLKLSETEKKQISEAVQQAESRTSGEIATAIIGQSYDYAIYELLSALLTGLIYSVVILSFSAEIQAWLQGLVWNYNIYLLTGFYIFSTFFVILLVYLLTNIPAIDRLIVPKRIQETWVKRRAGQHFWESGVAHTKDGTGILIFISVLEHRVELLADSGIAAKVEPERWQKIVNEVIEGIKQKNLAAKLCEAVHDCGDLLAKDFPRLQNDQNELSDNIVELES